MFSEFQITIIITRRSFFFLFPLKTHVLTSEREKHPSAAPPTQALIGWPWLGLEPERVVYADDALTARVAWLKPCAPSSTAWAQFYTAPRCFQRRSRKRWPSHHRIPLHFCLKANGNTCQVLVLTPLACLSASAPAPPCLVPVCLSLGHARPTDAFLSRGCGSRSWSFAIPCQFYYFIFKMFTYWL